MWSSAAHSTWSDAARAWASIVLVIVDAEADITELGQPDRHSPGAAAGVQHPGAGLDQGRAEGGLAVDVDAVGGQCREPGGVPGGPIRVGVGRPARVGRHRARSIRTASTIRAMTSIGTKSRLTTSRRRRHPSAGSDAVLQAFRRFIGLDS